eukprot:2373738-Prymnesium_polylepis.1
MRCRWKSATTLLATLSLDMRLSGIGLVPPLAIASVVHGAICPNTPAACAVARQCAWGEAIRFVPNSLDVEPPKQLQLRGATVIGSCDNVTLSVKPVGAAASYSWGLGPGSPSAPDLI